jgi:alcohol dehydrogenase
MRAAVTTAHGDRTTIQYREDVPEPTAGPDEVIVKVAATALNFHDIFTRRGMPGIKIPLPIIVGSDIAGEISDIGLEVSGWRRGDRVLVDPIYRDGKRIGMIGESANGGRAEYVAVPAAQLIKVPAGVSLAAAAALPLAYATAHRMLVTRGGVKAGETVLVLGASGGVGVACVQLAKLMGAKVIACASTSEKIGRLAAIGADHHINYTTTSIVDGVREICGKPRLWGEGGVDVAVNFTGGDTWPATQRAMKRHGRLLTCGATAGYDVTLDARFMWTFEHAIVGSNGWMMEDLFELLRLVDEGRLDPVIDKVLPFKEAAEAERLLEDREVVGKVILSPDGTV